MKIAIVGYGKMGKLIKQMAEQQGHQVVKIISSKNLEDLQSLNSGDVDVAIEFTHPSAALDNYKLLIEKGIPIVTGTTGWHERVDEMTKLVKDQAGSFFHASNFSIGVNILFKMNKMLAKLMQGKTDYKLTIKETHHTTKKDAPSGTAISLAEQILKHNPEKTKWINEECNERDIIPILSQRIADAKGFHEIEYASEVDTIQIRHNAKSREGFAQGAIAAAEWLQGKKGIFTKDDMMKD